MIADCITGTAEEEEKMSKETAKKLIAELQTNNELKAKIKDISDPAELAAKAVEMGYDVTLDELVEAEKKFKTEKAKKTRLSVEELETVAGGMVWQGEDAPDGHEMGCAVSYHDYYYQKDTGTWCKDNYYCDQNSQEYDPYKPDY